MQSLPKVFPRILKESPAARSPLESLLGAFHHLLQGPTSDPRTTPSPHSGVYAKSFYQVFF